MRKSSSAQVFKCDFVPSECSVGQSSIDRLPIRLDARRHSSQVVRISLAQEIEQLRNQNALLRNENQMLQRELESVKTRLSSGAGRTQEKVSGYREMIKNRLSSKGKGSRVITECETGLFSSKEVSMSHSLLTVAEWYDSYKTNNKLPTLGDLQEIADRFFNQYCEDYTKLKALFQCLQTNAKQQGYTRLSQLIDLYKLPLLYQKSPQTLLREVSKSKQKRESLKQKGKEKQKDKVQGVCWEVLSPMQTVSRIESLLSKVCRSSQMLKMLRGSDLVMKFMAKIQERS